MRQSHNFQFVKLRKKKIEEDIMKGFNKEVVEVKSCIVITGIVA